MNGNGTNGTGHMPTGMMKAQQIDPKTLKICLNEVPIPTPGETQILVKIICASLCHSDIMIFEPNEALQLPQKPTTMGHEATGHVVGTGAGVKGFKAGDTVGFIPASDVCYECYPCRNVHNLHCEKGTPIMQGFGADGYFAEYAVVDYRSAMILPETLDPVAAAALFCAGVTAFHAIDELRMEKGSWVAVVGCGGLGLLGVQYARAMGYRVIGLDVSTGGREEALALGAEHAFDPSASKTEDGRSYVERILEITGGGVDAAVNFTASKRAYDAMPAIIRPARGIFMIVGIPQQPLSINAFDVAMGRYRVMGANNGHSYNMRPAIEFSAKHNITSTIEYFPLENVPLMVERMQKHQARGRMAVKF